MTDEDNQQQFIKIVYPILQDYTDWYMQVMDMFFQNAPVTPASLPAIPSSIDDVMNDVDLPDLDNTLPVDQLREMHEALDKAAKNMAMADKNERGLPEKHVVDEFSDCFQTFFATMRRIELGAMIAETGLDDLTGLRNKLVMINELNREFERLQRQGKQFSIIMAIVDHFDEYIEKLTDDQLMDVVKAAGAAIKTCIRMYDDGYRVARREFVVCLKMTDTSGGFKFLDRLRNILEDMNYQVPLPEGPRPLSMSYNVGEPIPGDKMEDFLQTMREDLVRYAGREDNTIIEYADISPLQKYINDMKDN